MMAPIGRCSMVAVLAAALQCRAQTSATTSTTCLPNAVPPEQRKRLVIDGQEMPLGVWALSWQSAAMNAEIFKLLAEEVLGYEVVESGRSIVVVSGLWAIAGCEEVVSLESEALAKCELREGLAKAKSHLCFETWDFYLPATLSTLSSPKYSHRQPVKLGGPQGNMGFKGVSANWLPKEISQRALEEDGVALNHFVYYNTSRWSPSQYFDGLDEINTTEFFQSASRCSEYPPMNEDLDARDYLRHFPEDPGGVEVYVDSGGTEKMRGRCEDGVWWLSPACRANRSACIPWISVAGYGYSIMWHKATYYNMAIAMASTNNWVDVIYSHSVLNYAWIPDALFMDRNLEQLLFPGYVKDQHDDGFYVTEFAQVETEKWAHRDLEKAAPRVWITASNMNMTSKMMVSLLEHQSREGLDGVEGACYFLRSYPDWWAGWIPAMTNCQVGEGLFASEDGGYECRWCPRATASVPGVVPETGASTRFCEKCSAGYYQANTQSSECSPCSPGTVTDQEGAERCGRCKQGTYQPLAGSTACQACPAGRTTKVEQAEVLGDCVCARTSYEPVGARCRYSNDTCACVSCMEGLECELGSRLEAWVEGMRTGEEQADVVPQVLPGYYALPEDPVSIFKCQEDGACSGGQPASCAGGRIELTCTRCPGGFFLGGDRSCHRCEGHEIVAVILGVPLGVLGLTTAHVAVNWPVSKASKWTMTSVLLAGMGVTTCLTFNIYANLDFVAAPPLSDLFAALKILAFDTEVLRFSCVTGSDSQLVRYAAKLLGLPMAFCCMVFGAFCTRCAPYLRDFASFDLASIQNSIGMLFTIFFITISLMSLEAFRCDYHPNGKTSLTADRSVLCWDSIDHDGLVTMSILAVLAYPVPFLAITGLMTYNYGSWMQRCGTAFTLRSRFLFSRMGPDSSAFGFWYNLRNFALTLVPVVAANRVNLQVNLLMLVFVSWLLLQMHFLPWRFGLLNTFDAVTSAVQILMLSCFAMLGAAGSGAANEEHAAEVAGWTIVALFLILMGSIVVMGVNRILHRIFKRRDYSVFLSHHKDSCGRFARQVKMMMTKVTPRKIFLDVDELQNLDNLNFTVRSNTENLVVLMTPDTLSRLWVAVEITSAFMNDVPIHLAAASSKFVPNLDEQFLSNTPKMWSKLDIVEFNKAGIELSDIEAAYRFLATLPRGALHVDAPLQVQWSQTKSLLEAMGAPVREKQWVRDPEYHVTLCFDTQSEQQASTARVLGMLFEQAHWTVHDFLEFRDLGGEEAPGPRGVAIVLLARDLVGNAEAVGFIAAAYLRGLPVITTLGGESFWKPESGFFSAVRSSGIFTPEQSDQMSAFSPEASPAAIADALCSLYKILAWRFHPEETEAVMRTEFQRILERAEVEHSQRVSMHTASAMDSIKLDEAITAEDEAGVGDLASI